jgi:hypothetical protein
VLGFATYVRWYVPRSASPFLQPLSETVLPSGGQYRDWQGALH